MKVQEVWKVFKDEISRSIWRPVVWEEGRWVKGTAWRIEEVNRATDEKKERVFSWVVKKMWNRGVWRGKSAWQREVKRLVWRSWRGRWGLWRQLSAKWRRTSSCFGRKWGKYEEGKKKGTIELRTDMEQCWRRKVRYVRDGESTCRTYKMRVKEGWRMKE